MTKPELQRNIINILFDKAFADLIGVSGTEYSELELCSMVYRYAHTYDQCLNLLTLIKVNTDDKLLSVYITDIISAKKNESEIFHRTEPGCIYELEIVLDRYSATERYVCCDYETALEMIPKWHENYGDKARDTTLYTITKRRVLNCGDPFAEDFIASCVLNKDFSVLRYYSASNVYFGNNCDGECTDCNKKYCLRNVEITFPDMFKTGDLVYYNENAGINGYGVVLPEFSDSEEYCIIPLEGRNICYDMSKAHLDHIHVPKPYARGADESEISGGKGTLCKLYREYREFIGLD